MLRLVRRNCKHVIPGEALGELVTLGRLWGALPWMRWIDVFLDQKCCTEHPPPLLSPF